MKQFFIAVLLLSSTFISAQNFEDNWIGHFSYVSVKDISYGNDKVFVAAENAIFTYDLSTQEISTISTINGLSGKRISTFYYSENYNLFIIGYENGLLEVVKDNDENILQVVDILNKPTIPPNKKRINHFYEYDGNLYISTQYGISVYNLQLLEFGDTYFIGDLGTQIEISQITVLEDLIYAASSENGIRRANVNSNNLIDYEEWTTIENGGFKGIQALNTELYAAKIDNTIHSYSPANGFVQVGNFNNSIVDFQASTNNLIITTNSSIHSYGLGYTLLAEVTNLLEYDYVLQSGITIGNNFYMGTTEQGLLIVEHPSLEVQQVLPDGPLFNQPFAIDASPGRLWVAFGEVDLFFNPYPLTRRGISNYRNETWTNISYDELTTELGVVDVNDISYVTINPENASEVYMSSFQKGLLKIDNQTPEILFNETNSPLTVPNNDDAVGIRLYGSDFDRDENLWMVQSLYENGLIRMTSEGQFQQFDISDIVGDQALSELKISREGYVFFGATETGLVGYDPSSNSFGVISDGVGNGNLPTVNVRSLAFDNNNRLWIGTLKGLRELTNVGGVFDGGDPPDTRAIIILDDDGVAQELLFDQSITDIEVDGSNNKWVATATSGVFYFSPNGQETLLRFTTANSPLPSDNIQDIAIDDSTGTVYFATPDGLVAYKGSSTAPREDLENAYAFPNPVRPNYFGNVTIDGLTAKANVKITDVTGNLVYETTSEGGSVQWDTTAFGKYKVASGVYLVLITSDDALLTNVIKIMVIR